MTDLAILALTPRGLELGQRIQSALGEGGVVDAAGSTREVLQKTFAQARPMVCIMPLGIVVRSLGSLVQTKTIDPAVVVVDEAGTFVVTVLGRQASGATRLANEVALAIGATPIITMVGDVLQLPAVDMIGRQWAWKIEQSDNLTRAMAAVVQGKPVGVYQDAGRRDWWQAFGPWPHHFERVETFQADRTPQADPDRVGIGLAALLIISDRILSPLPPRLNQSSVIYRPPTLTLGVGCRRGVPCEEIEDCVTMLCSRHRLSSACITALASAALNKDQEGLIEFAEHREIPFLTYAPDRLALMEPLPTPSERVRARIGVAGICEPAAMLAAGVKELVVPKTKFPRVTLAVARRSHA